MDTVVEVAIRLSLELLFEVLLKGPGYQIVRMFRHSDDIQPDGCHVPMLGLSVWSVVGVTVWLVFFKH